MGTYVVSLFTDLVNLMLECINYSPWRLSFKGWKNAGV